MGLEPQPHPPPSTYIRGGGAGWDRAHWIIEWTTNIGQR